MRKKQEINGEIGQRIKAARERAGFTQDRLAKLTDVGVPYLAKRLRHIPERQYDLLEKMINSYLEAIQLPEIGKL